MGKANGDGRHFSVLIRGPDVSPDVMPEEEVVAAARQGSEKASEMLFRKYRGVVRRNIRPYFMKGAEREDLVQEGMIGLLNAIRRYDPGRHSSFYAFADLCIRRQVLTAIKRASRHKHGPLNESSSIDKPLEWDECGKLEAGYRLPAGSSPDPEEVLMGSEVVAVVKGRLLSLLSPLERIVLAAYLEGKTYGQIARQINRPEKSVDNALTRIRNKAGRLGSCFRNL